MSLEFTTRITDLNTLDATDANDELIIVDKSDLSFSAEGTDKKISPRRLVETAPIRPSDNLTIIKTTAEWIAEFRNKINDLETSTEPATTVTPGTVSMATDAQAIAKTNSSVAISPANLAALVPTDINTGLFRAATFDDARDGNVVDAAITPKALFDAILGAAVFGAIGTVMKFPMVNSDTNEIVYLKVQYGEVQNAGVFNTARAESNPNHTHPFVDIGVTFPEPFESRCFMVIPMGFDVSPDYDEGTEYIYRTRRQTLNNATIRASRIAGVNDSGEQIGVRYIAIGY